MRFCQNILHDFELHFSKSQLFSLFLTYNQIGASYGHGFLLTQRTRLSGPPKYLQRCRKAHKKFSRGIWKKKFQLKIWGFVRIFQPYFVLNFFLISWAELFSKPSRKFSVDFAGVFEVSKKLAWPMYLRQWKNRDHTTYQSDSTSG